MSRHETGSWRYFTEVASRNQHVLSAIPSNSVSYAHAAIARSFSSASFAMFSSGLLRRESMIVKSFPGFFRSRFHRSDTATNLARSLGHNVAVFHSAGMAGRIFKICPRLSSRTTTSTSRLN